MNSSPNNPVAAHQDLELSSNMFHLPPVGFRLPELLAPAGDWECARAAVENGADAIYFGLEKFNARMRAHNFTQAELPKLMEFLHRRGVKGYVTFNTLVFVDELAEAEQYLRAIISAGVDAAIVQDIGICRMIRRLSSDFPIHASTQMTITSAGGVEFARELGCTLVVLARECSLKEIEKIQASLAAQPTSLDHPLPLEVFVHGALCVAYSGQCLTSEALGGRSANRGECAQACRMPYELVSDGQTVPLGDRRYLLSPQDLAGLEMLPDLIRAGVASLKIEGRLKSPEYVANITRVYRQALDKCRTRDAEGGITPDPTPQKAGPQPITHNPRYEMEMAFSRGLHTGWFGGINNQQLVHGRFGKKRGVFLGDVTGVQDEKVFVELRAPLKPGDGVVFDAGHPESKEEGGRVYEVKVGRASRLPMHAAQKNANDARRAEMESPAAITGEPLALPCRAELRFGHGDLDFWRIHVGDKVWKTSDQDLDRRLRATFEGDQPRFQRPIRMQVSGRNGQPLVLLVRDEIGHVVQVTSVLPLAKAEKRPLTMERLREQLGRLGGTAFKLGELKNLLEPGVMLPVSELNRLRRDAVSRLDSLRAQPKRWTLNVPPASCPHIEGFASDSTPETSQLVVLVRNMAQLEAAVRCGVQTLYCEFEDTKKYREAVALFKDAGAGGALASTLGSQPSTIWVAPPRIFKTGEEWILDQVRTCNADGYLVRNHDHLKIFAGCRCVGDFSLNVANPLTADYFIHQHGLERVTASYDLNIAQLEALLRSAPPDWFEITIHQHMPMFHMEHCVFCAFLSNGTDFTNCGRPCDRHDVQLRDRVGALHPLKADAGCRNTVFNALAQTGAEFVSRMLARGARRFRIEFLNETPGQVERTIGMYRQLMRGEIEGAQLWRELKLLNQLGVTRGQMR
jgi:putative protease